MIGGAEMTGRDVVKFIVKNNLLDKSLSPDLILKFEDYLPNDEGLQFSCYSDGRYRVGLSDGSDVYLIDSGKLSDISMNGLKALDACIPENPILDPYNTYSCTFKQWLNNLYDEQSIMYLILQYGNEDSNFWRYCTTYNKAVSYLESKDVSPNLFRSLEIAWTQYMRECRTI